MILTHNNEIQLNRKHMHFEIAWKLGAAHALEYHLSKNFYVEQFCCHGSFTTMSTVKPCIVQRLFTLDYNLSWQQNSMQYSSVRIAFVACSVEVFYCPEFPISCLKYAPYLWCAYQDLRWQNVFGRWGLWMQPMEQYAGICIAVEWWVSGFFPLGYYDHKFCLNIASYCNFCI
jgi:hypothetical protein